MEQNPELEFEFYLATKLGKTLAELRQMDQHEFGQWAIYFGRKAQRQQLEMSKPGR